MTDSIRRARGPRRVQRLSALLLAGSLALPVAACGGDGAGDGHGQSHESGDHGHDAVDGSAHPHDGGDDSHEPDAASHPHAGQGGQSGGHPEAGEDGHAHAMDAAIPPDVPVDAGSPPDGSIADDFEWNLPPSIRVRPPVPDDNPMSRAKVELGRRLFYDPRLSDNETFSCATCHEQRLAFTDGRATGLGSTGEAHSRSPMSLANVGYTATLTWANPLMTTLERQVNVPLFGDMPIELGLGSIAAIEDRLSGVELYQDLFADAFPESDEPVTANHMNKALAAFQRTLISGNSPYDRWQAGDQDAVDESAKRGYALFFGHPFECFHCHAGFNFSDHTTWEGKAGFDAPYHNTGLYNVDGKGAYPPPNTGVHDVTLNPSDMGRFKVPTLRNIAVTAPYMHDGSIATLEEVLDHYAAGGRTIAEGPYAGVGSESPLKDPVLTGFPITEQERADLIEFLKSLTDEEFLTNPEFADPWQ